MIRAKAGLAIAAACALTLSGCGFQGLYGTSLPGGADLGDHPFKITAYFDDALDLVPQSAVRVNDVAVGKVTSISLSDWSAKVTLEVNNSVKLPANATAEIAQTSLLGEKFVSLDAPTSAPSGQRLGGGDIVGCPGLKKVGGKDKNGKEKKLPPCVLAHTRSAAEVEQVLGALSLLLNEGGLRQIRVIGDELVTALKGREPQIKDLLTQLNTFVGTLDNQKDDITNALVSIDKLSITLNRQKQVLVDALNTYPAALQVLSQERTKLVTLLSSLNNLGSVATNVINATQSDLVSSLKALNPVLTQLRASGADFPQSLKILATFPFPLGTTRTLVRGDYANLDAFLNLDLGNLLCQLNKALCILPSASTNTAKPEQTGNTARSRELTPMIIGSGR